MEMDAYNNSNDHNNTQYQQPGCFMNMIASMWVYLYHGMKRPADLERDGAEVGMSLIQEDLETCASRLEMKETELMERIDQLTMEAKRRMGTSAGTVMRSSGSKVAKDPSGAKRILAERRRVQGQLDKLRSSMAVIDTHINTIKGTELDLTILETLKASGDALKKVGLKGGLKGVEDIVAEVETQVENANEITRVIASGSVAGVLNGIGGDVMTEEEMEEELNELLNDGDDNDEMMIQAGMIPKMQNAMMLSSSSSYSAVPTNKNAGSMNMRKAREPSSAGAMQQQAEYEGVLPQRDSDMMMMMQAM